MRKKKKSSKENIVYDCDTCMRQLITPARNDFPKWDFCCTFAVTSFRFSALSANMSSSTQVYVSFLFFYRGLFALVSSQRSQELSRAHHARNTSDG